MRELGTRVKNAQNEPAQTARYAMKREVAALEAGFSVEYVRFQTGRRNTVCREWLYGVVRLPNGCAASKTCDLQPIYAYRKLKPVRSLRCKPGFFMGNGETPGPVCGFSKTRQTKFTRRRFQVAVKEKIRIRIKGYDHQLVDQAAGKIVETARRTGARVSGPVPLPTEKEIVTILRAVH